MFLNVWDTFQEQRVVCQGDVIEQDKVLMNLAHVSDMWHNR